jgi:hypothetical protein
MPEESSEKPGRFVLEGLSYTTMVKSSDAADVLLSMNDKLRNGAFSSAVSRAWRDAVTEATAGLDEAAGGPASPHYRDSAPPSDWPDSVKTVVSKREAVARERGILTLIRLVDKNRRA